jgi:hypothetical protein
MSAGTGAQVRLHNSSTQTAFVVFGTSSSITASTTTSMPLPPGDVEVFTVPPQTSYVAVIGTSSTGTFYATPGEGV